MKRLILAVLILFLTVNVEAKNKQDAFVFEAETIAGGATSTSDSIYVGDSDGYFSIDGTISSATPDHSLTFQWFRSWVDPDDPTTFYVSSTAEGTIASTVTGTTFNYPFSPNYMTHIVIKATNLAGEETATLTLKMRFK